MAAITSEATLRRSFTQALEGESAAFAYDDWRSAFLAARGDPDTRRLLVIDEYPYLAGAVPGVGTVLQAVWDEVLEGSRLMVVLCGSHIGMMEREAVSYRAPLFGRRTGQIRLRPLPPWGVAAMLPGYGAAAIVRRRNRTLPGYESPRILRDDADQACTGSNSIVTMSGGSGASPISVRSSPSR